MNEDYEPLDLADADDARRFLLSLVINGKEVKRFHTSTGRSLTVEQMTDEEAIAFANQMHQEMFDGKEYVDTRVNKLLN